MVCVGGPSVRRMSPQTHPRGKRTLPSLPPKCLQRPTMGLSVATALWPSGRQLGHRQLGTADTAP